MEVATVRVQRGRKMAALVVPLLAAGKKEGRGEGSSSGLGLRKEKGDKRRQHGEIRLWT